MSGTNTRVKILRVALVVEISTVSKVGKLSVSFMYHISWGCNIQLALG